MVLQPKEELPYCCLCFVRIGLFAQYLNSKLGLSASQY